MLTGPFGILFHLLWFFPDLLMERNKFYFAVYICIILILQSQIRCELEQCVKSLRKENLFDPVA